MTSNDSSKGDEANVMDPEKTKIMDSEVLNRLVAQSRHPPSLPRSEQPTVPLPRPPRMPQG